MSSRFSNRALVFDTGPLIALARLDLWSEIRALFSKIYITEQVWEESQFYPDRQDALIIADLVSAAHACREVIAVEADATHTSSLGQGGLSSIHLAAIKNCPVVLDDRLARQYAKHRGVPVTGTVGLLLYAKEQGVIASVSDCFDSLVLQHYYLSDELVAKAKQLAGE